MLVLRAFSCDAKPSKDSIAQWYDPSAGENSGVIAGMKIAASVPSVNLDNIEGVSSITCTENKVTMAPLRSPMSWLESGKNTATH
ncbi:hypothetical protein BASA62_002108 [Batrachochytrium salamandrivorans]|nr:hypothetical protein BASA62_002108 [Batrachochytrium salamandrivorans]